MTLILQTNSGVTLLGGGEVSAEDLDFALTHAPVLVCADGGADHALAYGREPAAIIGDMDSASEAARARWGERITLISEQDSTDFGKCLRSVAAPLYLALGFCGGRMDHSLAAMSALLRARPDQKILMLAPQDVIFKAPARLRLDLPACARVSLFPMGPVRGRSTGLRWPIDGLELTPAGRIGTSNAALGGPVEIDTAGEMLVLLERGSFAQAFAAI